MSAPSLQPVEGSAAAVPPLGAGVHAPPDLPTLTGIWKAMLLARTFEERVIALYRQNRVTGGVYTGTGNEAVAVGTAWPMAPEDVLSRCTAISARTSCAATRRAT